MIRNWCIVLVQDGPEVVSVTVKSGGNFFPIFTIHKSFISVCFDICNEIGYSDTASYAVCLVCLLPLYGLNFVYGSTTPNSEGDNSNNSNNSTDDGELS